jgi:hypothetical protein
MTFLKWLESQQSREDAVGRLAREVHAPWGRSWREVGACFHFGGQNWPKTLSNLHHYLSTTLDYLDPRYDCPPPVSDEALNSLPEAWAEWQALLEKSGSRED